MFSKYFESVEWLGIFSIIVMILFVISFVIMIIWTFRLDKNKLEEYSNLPLKK
jgi:hypothetical protein